MRILSILTYSLFTILLFSGMANSQVSRIMGSGTDDGKIVIGVIGDGYTRELIDNGKYAQDVENLVTNGLFADDVFSSAREAFSVHRLDIASREEGVSRPGFPKDTAINLIFSGLWERCWIEATPEMTYQKLKDLGVDFYDYLIIIVNESDPRGGCHPGGNRLYVTNAVAPSIIAHEFGHTFAGLLDEYTAKSFIEHPATQEFNYNNCSNVIDRDLLLWKGLLTPLIGLPTFSFPDNTDPSQVVGMFEGCNYATKGLYRSMWTCRMKEPHDPVPFCKVCRQILSTALRNLLPRGHLAIAPLNKTLLKLTVKISGDKAEILRYTQQTVSAENLPVLTPTGRFVFEFSGSGKTIAVGSLSQNPLTVRSFPDRENNRGEILPPAKSVTTVINIPIEENENITKEKLQLNVYEINVERLTTNDQILNLDRLKLEKLKKDSLLKKNFQIKNSEFKEMKLGI